jgi:D-xylose transport system substrate-binding protein
VYFLIPTSNPVRFVTQDAPDFQAAMAKLSPGTKVVVENADGDSQKQLSQVQTAISAGASAIVLDAADPQLTGGALQQAAKAKVPVLLYDNEADGGPATALVVADQYNVGVLQGESVAGLLSKSNPKSPLVIARIYGNEGNYGTTEFLAGQNKVLDPLIAAGKIKVACETYTPNWDATHAQTEMAQCLTKTNDHLDAVVTMADGLAGGIIAALKQQGVAGKIPVYGGQDADLQAIQYILLGLQHDTVYKSFKTQATKAAELTVQLLANGKISAGQTTGYVDNGFMKPGVPTAFFPVQLVTTSNVATVVNDGLWTWKQICTGAAAATPTCQKEAP